MKILKKGSFFQKLMISHLVVGLFPVFLISSLLIENTEKATRRAAFSKMRAIQDIKGHQIEVIVKDYINDTALLSLALEQSLLDHGGKVVSSMENYLSSFVSQDSRGTLILISSKGTVENTYHDDKIYDGVHDSFVLESIARKVKREKKLTVFDFT